MRFKRRDVALSFQSTMQTILPLLQETRDRNVSISLAKTEHRADGIHLAIWSLEPAASGENSQLLTESRNVMQPAV